MLVFDFVEREPPPPQCHFWQGIARNLADLVDRAGPGQWTQHELFSVHFAFSVEFLRKGL
jgi:hypothetical protein